MKFRKKPIVIEAIRWQEGMKLIDIYKWAEVPYDLKEIEENQEKPFYLGNTEAVSPDSVFIETLEGDMECKVGDWIIKGVNGEFYPCKNDIFEKSYESVILANDFKKPRPNPQNVEPNPDEIQWIKAKRAIYCMMLGHSPSDEAKPLIDSLLQ